MAARYKPRSMSPSGAYSDALARSPKHDKMQVNVMRALFSDEQYQAIRFSRQGKTLEATSIAVIPEFDFTVQGSIIGFADLVQMLELKIEGNKASYKPDQIYTFYRIFELKPEIASIGGLIRQCKVLAHQAHACLKRQAAGSSSEIRIDVFPVVRDDDPDLADFQYMFGYSFFVWNEQKLKLTLVRRKHTL